MRKVRHQTPSPEEFKLLQRKFAENPGGESCALLGYACLSQGQVQEAIAIGAKGLAENPGNSEARLMVATGFYKLHEWKKSQVELTKIIKTDKTSVDAFTMLGEVLLRQGDRQRALPVLKHALGLDKHDPKIKVLLECAKTGSKLPPVNPLPPVIEPSKKLGRVGLKKRRAETGDLSLIHI